MPSPIRSSMADLIARARTFIGDTATPQTFTDDIVQDALDRYRHTVRYAPLIPGPTLQPGSLYDYLDYYASQGNWENDEILSWVNWATLTPATSDRITGHWTFSLPAPGQYPPVYITGKFYDVFAAAADLLENWAALMAATAYDFSSDGQSFKRSQLVQGKLMLAKVYRQRAMATSHRTMRSDINAAHNTFSLGMGGPGDVGGSDSQ